MSTATVTRVRKKIEGLSRRLEALEKRIERVKRGTYAAPEFAAATAVRDDVSIKGGGIPSTAWSMTYAQVQVGMPRTAAMEARRPWRCQRVRQHQLFAGTRFCTDADALAITGMHSSAPVAARLAAPE